MKAFNVLLQAQFTRMCTTGQLYRVNLTGREIWNLYLSSFKLDNNPKFRDPESSSKNCNHCNNFIRRYGNIVALTEDLQIMTLFDVIASEEYIDTAQQLSRAIRASDIKDIFMETFNELKSLPYEQSKREQETFRLGTEKNIKRYTKEEAELYGVVKANQIITFDHLHLNLPKEFVDFSNKSIESISAIHKSNFEVFLRGMEEIPLDTLNLVQDLINQGSLLNGETHLHKIHAIIPLKEEYDALIAGERAKWAWKKSRNFTFAKFRNELIGVLCIDLAEGKEINDACKVWNIRVDPVNFMKATAPITKRQIEEAEKFVTENEYVKSFARRVATIEDINISEIKHSSGGDGKIKTVSMFDKVKPGPKSRHKRNEFKDIEEVNVDKFFKDILPSCTSVEAFLDNSHANNMVTMTTSEDEESKKIFKWDNNYSWTFNGNLAGKSEIKEAVKDQGGLVVGPLRFSIMWAEDDIDNSDLDAHCLEPKGFNISWRQKISSKTGGTLDIDITEPQNHKKSGRKVVENIIYPSLARMIDGDYELKVNQFSARNSKGFKAEVEVNGDCYSYEYNRAVKGKITVAIVTLKKGVFTIKHVLPEVGVSSREVYGLDTNHFHKVNLVCLSPNHWENNKIGNKHYFFMLEKAKAELKLRSFHIENLTPELAAHRKVMEVLGNTHMIEPDSDKQLSGLGFNATVRDEVVLKLGGNFNRMIKVKF